MNESQQDPFHTCRHCFHEVNYCKTVGMPQPEWLATRIHHYDHLDGFKHTAGGQGMVECGFLVDRGEYLEPCLCDRPEPFKYEVWAKHHYGVKDAEVPTLGD